MRALILFISFVTISFAQVDHSQHHPAPSEEKNTKDETIDPTTKNEMAEMMKKCSEKNKDKKMCQESMMKDCMMKMGKDKCAKMMQNN